MELNKVKGTLIELKTGAFQEWHYQQVAAYSKMIECNWTPEGWKKDDSFLFDRDTHLYYYDGVAVLSVTQTIRANQKMWADEKAMGRGTWIHEYCEMIDSHCPNLDNIDLKEIEKFSPGIKGKVESYRRFKQEWHFEKRKIENEVSLCHPVEKYAGTIDKWSPGNEEMRRLILYLKANGDYQVRVLGQDKIEYYYQKFLQAKRDFFEED